VVPLDDAIVFRHAGTVEARSNRPVLLQIGRYVHLEKPFQGAIRGWQLQKIEVKRRPGGSRNEPVAAQDRLFAFHELRQCLRDVTCYGEAVWISRGQTVPLACRPFVIAQVETIDCPRGVDSLWEDNARMPREAVDEFGQGMAMGL